MSLSLSDGGLALQTFLDALSEPALLVDRDLIIQAANAALAARVGVAVEKLRGNPAFDFIPEPIADERRARVLEVLKTGQGVEFEDERAGRSFLNYVMPVSSADNQIDFAAIFAVDITKLRQTEHSLHASESRYQRIIENCIEGVWEIDQENRTTFVNRQMAMMLGYDVEEFLGRSLYDFMDEEAVAEAEKNVERRRGGIAEHHKFRLRHKDGSDIWTEMATNPLYDSSGQYCGAVALVADITERRKFEQQLLQTQKLESLGVLAGGIAHDFNNLKRAIPADSEAAQYVQGIAKAAETAAALTNELLTYSGQSQSTKTPLSINEVLLEVSTLLERVISKDAELILDLGANLPDLRGDATHIRQVAMNFITNASDALCDKPGVIRATTTLIHLDESKIAELRLADGLQPGPYICLEVSDTGKGMDEETMTRMFDPFFTTNFTGRGLGLAAVLGSLGNHEAGIGVQSSPGAGTSVRAYFPSLGRTSEATVPDASSEEWQAEGLVLVVDDEEYVREMTAKALREAGLQVIKCANGGSALQTFKAQREEIDVVLLDRTMPGMSGSDVYRELLAINPEVRVVFTSGYSADSLPGSSKVGFLQKPYSLEELWSAIQAAMELPR
jgi:PAS domain S-box-containing protein